jgi:hypothetical protein
VKAKLQRIAAYAGRDRLEMRNKSVREARWLKGTGWPWVFLRWIGMIKRLIVIMFALGAHHAPANAASPSPFAHDAAGRAVLEFYPATAVKFNAEGRDLVSVTVKETPPENDARGPSDLALIVDCRLHQLAVSRIAAVAKDGMPPTTVAGFKTSDLRPPPRGHVSAICHGGVLRRVVGRARLAGKERVEAFSREPAAWALFRKRERQDNRQGPGGVGAPL